MDTLLLANLTEDFAIAEALAFSSPGCAGSRWIMSGELSSKAIGSLISVYALTGNSKYLDRAMSLGECLLGAFGRGAPLPIIDGVSGRGRKYIDSGYVPLSDFASFALEMSSLSSLSGDSRFSEAVASFIRCVSSHQKSVLNEFYSTSRCESHGSGKGSSLNTGFFIALSSLAKLHSHHPPAQNESSSLMKAFAESFSGSLTDWCGGNRFDLRDCEVRSLSPSFDENFRKMCDDMRSTPLPATHVTYGRWEFDISEAGFDFESPFVPSSFTISEILASSSCGKGHCMLSRLSPRERVDLQPSSCLGNWLKRLLLRTALRTPDGFVLSRAGHIIPTKAK